MFTAKNMDKVVSLGQMEAHTTVNLKRIIFRDTGPTTGPTEECLSALGSIIRWKVREPSHGRMVESMKAITLTTRRKVKALSIGLTVENTKVDGRMASSTEMDTTHLQVVKLSKEDGMKVRGFIG